MIYAVLWQLFAFVAAVKAVRRHGPFDIIQHLTYGNLWLPSFLFLIPGTYILGPVGGGVVPASFAANYRMLEKGVESLRFFALRYLRWINLPMLLNMFRARLILARTEDTVTFLPGWARSKAKLLPETALNVSHFPFDRLQRQRVCKEDLFTVVYAGRIMSLKNLHLAVQAFRTLLDRYPQLSGRVGFDIYGEGPYQQICRDLAGDEAGRSIIFHGFIARETLLERLRDAHLFVHLSAKDTAATAPMEAMALGLPVICIKCGGMGNLVDETCGILLEPSKPERIVEETVESFRKLAEDRELLLNLSIASREKIEREFDWERRIEQYNDIVRRELADNI
jgi:glycosyltransferase involved in cell wall biosynthesis